MLNVSGIMTDQLLSGRDIGGYRFRLICFINPARDETGAPLTFLPQSRYRNSRGLKHHSYGHGPFCQFRIPSNLPLEGVYALLIGNSVCYVGECIQLSKRFNMGYGQISPRNCFDRGQPTNCKVNQLVLEAGTKGEQVQLWFLETLHRTPIESELIRMFNPPWNAQGKV